MAYIEVSKSKKLDLFRVESTTEKFQGYIVHHYLDDNSWTCTCPNWQYRLKDTGRSCKHIEEVRRDNSKYVDLWATEPS